MFWPSPLEAPDVRRSSGAAFLLPAEKPGDQIGPPKVIDFGIAKATSGERLTDKKTAPGATRQPTD